VERRTSAKYKVLYSFQAKPNDGAFLVASLVDVHGTLYGTTEFGGGGSACSACGTVYSITAAGMETVLHVFAGGTEGANPIGGFSTSAGCFTARRRTAAICRRAVLKRAAVPSSR
jgi:uncharacterized repeat protein (TIGR03803 family)